MFRDLPWSTIFLLGIIGLIRPLLSFAGLFDTATPAGSMIVSVVIAMIWIAVTVRMQVQQPVLTLAVAGAVYAILSILLTIFFQTAFSGTAGDAPVSASLLLTAGLAGALIMNVIWGAFLGMTSQVIIKVRNSRY